MLRVEMPENGAQAERIEEEQSNERNCGPDDPYEGFSQAGAHGQEQELTI